jgi:UDP-glucose 4-epimerase
VKIGVTGAGGFIGRHLLAALGAAGHEAVALVRRPLAGHASPVATELCDVAGSLAEVQRAVSGLDAVIHAAAYVPRNYRDPDEADACQRVNAGGTLTVLRACRAAAVGRVVVLSGNVYRAGAAPVDEDAPIDPSSSAPYYLASKATADAYALHFDRAEGLPVAVLRPSAVYGPGLARGMIATFAGRLAAHEPVTVADGGRYRADLVYVEDLARATVTAATGDARGPFNLGAGVTVGAEDIAAALADLLGAPRSLITVAPPAGDAPVGFAPLAIERARRVLGYHPRALTDGLAGYLAWRAAEAA